MKARTRFRRSNAGSCAAVHFLGLLFLSFSAGATVIPVPADAMLAPTGDARFRFSELNGIELNDTTVFLTFQFGFDVPITDLNLEDDIDDSLSLTLTFFHNDGPYIWGDALDAQLLDANGTVLVQSRVRGSQSGPSDFGYQWFFGPEELLNGLSFRAIRAAFTLPVAAGQIVGSIFSMNNPSPGPVAPPWPYVPEPGTLTLFGLGLAGLGLSRRRLAA